MEKNLVIALVLGVLVVVAVLQTVQLVTFKNKLATGEIKTGSATTPVQANGGGNTNLPSNLQNLPSMVGGC